jgi:hypothetical protein
MRRLRRLRQEGGAVIVLVAIAIVALMGMAGLAVDVGAVYGTRAELSRGADAVALAVGQECILDPDTCSTEGQEALAQYYAAANLDHGAATLAGFEVNADEGWVEVITESFQDATFMRVLGFTGTTVQARALAIWGPLGGGAVAPFTFPQCVHNLEEEFIYRFQNIGETDCEDGNPPGGFGFIEVGDGCISQATSDSWIPGDPGTNWVCSQEEKEALQNAIILVPLHDPEQTIGTGTNAEYKIVGMAAFRITGYNLPGGGPPTWPTGFTCGPGPGSACIRGIFVRDFVPEGDIGGIDFGVSVVKLVE